MKSFLYHAFGVKGYREIATRYRGGEIIIELEPDHRPAKPEKGEWVSRGSRWRKVKSLQVGFKPVVFRVKVPRWINNETGEEMEQSPPLSIKGATCAVRSRGSSRSSAG